MKPTPELMSRIEERLTDIDYGRVTIIIDQGGKTADIVVEERERVQLTSPGLPPVGPRVTKHG